MGSLARQKFQIITFYSSQTPQENKQKILTQSQPHKQRLTGNLDFYPYEAVMRFPNNPARRCLKSQVEGLNFHPSWPLMRPPPPRVVSENYVESLDFHSHH